MARRSPRNAARQVILVDSSVWVDYFRGARSAQANQLDALLGSEPLAVGDLILAEVLQGLRKDRDFAQARRLLTSLDVLTMGGVEIALQAAANHRALRALGVTARKTVDTVIATWCIVHDCSLLHSDSNFDAFEKHLGLRCVR